MATSTTFKLAGIAAGIGIFAGGIVLTISLMWDSGDSPAASPTAPVERTVTATPPPEASPTRASSIPEVIDGISVKALTVGSDAAFPNDAVVYYRLGCYACDVGSASLLRIYRDSQGTITSEDALANLRKVTGEFFAGPGWVADDRFANFVATVCKGPACIAAGVGAPPGGSSQVYRSSDGGRTWREDGTIPALSVLAGWTRDGTVVSTWAPPGQEYRYFYLESGRELVPFRAGLSLTFLRDMPPMWIEHNGRGFSYYDLAGNLVYSGGHENERIFARAGTEFLVSWRRERPVKPGENRFSTYIARTSAAGTPSAIYSWVATETFWPAQQVSAGTLAASVLLSQGRNPDRGSGRQFDFEAAFVDLGSGVVSPLRELSVFDVGIGGSGNINPFLIGVVTGSVLRVISGADCLNVRESPDIASKSLGCFADGVLLSDLKEAQSVGAITWRKVSPPGASPPGWASAEFLR
jgi:hypothetical protein